MLDGMIAEFGWEFDDDEVTSPDGTSAVGVQGFMEVWKHLVHEAGGELELDAEDSVGADCIANSTHGVDRADEVQLHSDRLP
jgi:hypothetical protein